jgi:hypothetical protein
LYMRSREAQSHENIAWFARFTPDEIGQMGNIIIDHQLAGDVDLENLTPVELHLMLELLSRPIKPLPPINKDEPVCHICRWRQPARERDGSWPICDECWKYMLGNAWTEADAIK